MSKDREARIQTEPLVSRSGFRIWQSAILRDLGLEHGFLGNSLDVTDKTALFAAQDLIVTAKVPKFHLKQTHGTEVACSSEFFSSSAVDDLPEADGSYNFHSQTGDNVALCIRTADCAPVLISSQNKRIQFALHCGWRSSVGGILEEAVKIALHHGFEARDLLLAIGPCARSCCYEVGIDFEQNLLQDKKNKQYLDSVLLRNQRGLFFDLQGFLLLQARSLGIPAHNCELLELCTMCNLEFFSHRRQKADAGRQLSYIVSKSDSI